MKPIILIGLILSAQARAGTLTVTVIDSQPMKARNLEACNSNANYLDVLLTENEDHNFDELIEDSDDPMDTLCSSLMNNEDQEKYVGFENITDTCEFIENNCNDNQL